MDGWRGIAKDGGQAARSQWAACGNRQVPQVPDLILLDINMPIVNGWEFMDKYQSLSAEQKAKIVVVMLTTSLNPDDRSRAESIKDIKDFVSKPLDETTLKDIIEKHFN